MNKSGIHEIGVATVKGGVGLIPCVGPLLAELIGVFANKKSKQRFAQWTEMVEKRLEKLEKPIDENNEKFFSALVKTTQIVAKTHQKEKLEYLANALINSADVNLDDDLNQFFLDLIEKYTCSHIFVLKSYKNPSHYDTEWLKLRLQTVDLRKIYETQLSSDGLLGFNNFAGGIVLLPLGEEFLRFVSDNRGAK